MYRDRMCARIVTVFIALLNLLGVFLGEVRSYEGIDCYSTPHDVKCTGFTISDQELDRIASSVCSAYPGVPGFYHSFSL